jgi:hypothetical protein
MNEPDLTAFAGTIGKLIEDAIQYQRQLSPERIRAMQYYDGEMVDVPPRKGWSAAVSRDVRAVMSKAMPSIMRTIVGNDKIVEFPPQGEGDEDQSEQISDFVNQVIIPESNAVNGIHDACYDALLLRNGIITWGVDKKIRIEGSEHSGLNEMELAYLAAADDVEILEKTVEEVEPQEGVEDGKLYSVKIKRRCEDRKFYFRGVPLENFLITSEALCIEEANLCGIQDRLTRSTLISMGYDADTIEALPAGDDNWEREVERFTRRKTAYDRRIDIKELEYLDYYDVYARIDFDGDGIAELRHVIMAGGMGAEHILVNDYADEAPFADVVSERRAHQWEGYSVPDDMIEIQRIKTALLRYGLDNVYWQNTRQPIVNSAAVQNPESVMNPEFGRPILLNDGYLAKDAISYNEVPFAGDKIFAFMEYWDKQTVERTGIDDSSAGLPADAVQNMTAKASAMIEQKGIARIEMVVNSLAMGGLKKAFLGLLKAVIKHSDKERTVRLRDKWVTVDPRSWNAPMDCKVNTGLGAGTRERDMLVMQQVMLIQEKLVAGFGPDNPFVKPQNVYNTLEALIEAAGLKTPATYFTKPDPQEVEVKMQQMREAKPIEIQKIEAQAMADKSLKEAELPFEVEKAKLETAAAAEKERAQSQAAVDEAIAIAQIEARDKQADRDLKRYEVDQKIALEREKMAQDARIAETQRSHELEKHKADSIGKEVFGLNEMANKPAKDAGPKLVEILEKMAKPRKIKIVRDENDNMIGAEDDTSEAA